MPSETETMEKDKSETPVFRLKTATSASETDQKSYWNELRRFYRTGEKHDQMKHVKLRSVFSGLPVLEGKGMYPFMLNNNEFHFSQALPFELLNQHIIDAQENKINGFKLRLEHLIDGLKKLLHVKVNAESAGAGFDFASEIIAFDKLSGMLPTREGDKLTPARSKRLSFLIEDLKDGLESYEKSEAVILDAVSALKNKKVFSNAEVIPVVEKEAFREAEKELKKQMKLFIGLIRSIRIAELEVNGEYKEDVHHEFFEHFSWYRLTEAEKSLFHPVILLIDHLSLSSQLDAYTSLLSLNRPVKIVILNHGLVSEPDGKTDWEEASHRFRQELSTLTISHRNVFVFQATLYNPDLLSEGLGNFIKTNNPAIVHLLLPVSNKADDVMVSKAAVCGRHFPILTYDPSATGNRIQLKGNENTSEDWPKYEISLTSDDEHIAKLKTEFTYADYKALFESKVAELMIVPPSLDSKDLVPLHEYLSLKEDELVGRLPFIWLTDQKSNLIKAVVPNVWVVSCQERLDFWNFLQELGNIHANNPEVEEEMPDEEAPASDKMAALRTAHEHELKKVREEAVSQAAGQLLQALLNGEDVR